ncbi:alpha/beta hydrolase family protein [Dyella amyloliquefaciens]|uniref:alpha/beta hydrolase family protein n=1 Tax=Dyella amyloliquefaciens TaxID=1770545 RepID=UPI00197AAE9A|nr:hypothetical protein [Dyella amyloliquefaciens]
MSSTPAFETEPVPVPSNEVRRGRHLISARIRLFVCAALLCGSALIAQPICAQKSQPVRVTSDVQYEFIGRWDVARLNQILQVDTPKFFDIPVTYTSARNSVRLYRVTYRSVIPEMGNQPTTATGLLAIPETSGKAFPVVSYQHGTVYGKHQVPSFPEESGETKLMIAQFAGQGYVVEGADYFGMGAGSEPHEGFMVKSSHQQAVFDMNEAAHAVMANMKLRGTDLFLAGWSQGGFVTMAALEKFERDGVPVTAVVTASAPVDALMPITGFIDFPRKNDAPWTNALVVLTAFSFENYYGVPGLAQSVFNPAYYDAAKAIYDRTPGADLSALPADLHKLIRPEYFDPQFLANSEYGRLLAKDRAYQWVIKTPVRNYYGTNDEVISVGLGQLAANYQHAIGSGNDKVQAVSTGPTTHRGTYASAVPEWKIWFDSLAGAKVNDRKE